MKIFVSESGLYKDSKLSEIELDENIIATKDAYISIKNDFYDVSYNINLATTVNFYIIVDFT